MTLSKEGKKKDYPHHRNVLDDLQREKLSKKNASISPPKKKSHRLTNETHHKKGSTPMSPNLAHPPPVPPKTPPLPKASSFYSTNRVLTLFPTKKMARPAARPL